MSMPFATQSKAWDCGRSLAGTTGSNPVGGIDVCLSFVSVVGCQVEFSTTGRSPVQRSLTECVCVCVI